MDKKSLTFRVDRCQAEPAIDLMKSSHKIIIGDARKLSMIADESVHLVVTSPPYWQLKDYGEGRQIGFHDTYEAYINHLNLVWFETYRVLKPGCRLCINIGDQFARAAFYGRYKIIPIRTEIIKFCEVIGYDYMGAIIWQKITSLNTTGGAVIMGSYPFPRNGILKLDYEFILIFKKAGETEKVSPLIKQQSKLSLEEWNEYFCGHWQFAGEKQKEHLAVYPSELPTRLIKMFSFVGDTVLDPFLGSGTTSVSAKNLNRHSIGVEINQKFLPVIKKRMEFYEPGIFDVIEIQFIKDLPDEKILTEKIKQMPYIFNDPNKFSIKRKTPAPARRSGLKGDQTEEQYFTVKKILRADLIKLSNGKNIRLLGIKIRKNQAAAALAFLEQKTKSQAVYVRFEQNRSDRDGNWLGYLYLRNKTFLNAHLIKAGFAVADRQKEFRHRARFISYQQEAERLGKIKEI